MKLLLALETTCDETAAAVVSDDLRVLGASVASQDALHERFGGVVPEIAARAHLERILPVIDAALQQANVSLGQLDLIAVAHQPGLAGSLLVGVAAAKGLALALDCPLVAVNHVHAHLYACRLAHGPQVFPCVGLVVSGGHTSLFRCATPLEFQWLGGTIDDAAGEAFDKVAAMLGLGYPGGPAIDRAASTGNPRAHRFPRSFVREPERLEFSFSGLKTAVRYAISGPEAPTVDASHLTPAAITDLAASFQAAIVETLVAKTSHALHATGLRQVCVGGGVAANRQLRQALEELAQREQARVFVAPLNLCTDNAVMGAIAWERFRAGLIESLELDAVPGLWRLGTSDRSGGTPQAAKRPGGAISPPGSE